MNSNIFIFLEKTKIEIVYTERLNLYWVLIMTLFYIFFFINYEFLLEHFAYTSQITVLKRLEIEVIRESNE